MDSISQILLGASVAVVATAPARHRRIIAWSALLATLPDLDVFIPIDGDLETALAHRTWSHSWIVQSILSPIIAAGIYKIDKSLNYIKWLWLTWLVLITHSALDTFTLYGTHLFWPISKTPLFIGSIFIVDPLYTLPFLLITLVAIFANAKQAYKLLLAGLILSSSYLVWTLIGQQITLNQAKTNLSQQNISYAKLFIGPTYFNSFLWRVVALDKDKYHEGFYSVFDKQSQIKFTAHPRNLDLLQSLDKIPAADKINNFSHGYFSLERKNQNVLISDLRMGWSENYFFKFKIAQITDEKNSQSRLSQSKSLQLRLIEPQHIYTHPFKEEIIQVWNRIWQQPPRI